MRSRLIGYLAIRRIGLCILQNVGSLNWNGLGVSLQGNEWDGLRLGFIEVV